MILLAALAGCAGLDKLPPQVALECPPSEPPISGLVAVEVSASDARPGLGGLHLLVDEQPHQAISAAGPKTASTWTLDTSSLEDGVHNLHAVAYDASRRENAAESSCHIVTDNTPPTVRLATTSRAVDQGDTLAVFLQLEEEPLSISGSLFDQPLDLHRVNQQPPTWRALVGVAHDRQARAWPLTVRATDASGNAGEQVFEVTVRPVEFEYVGTVYLSPEDQREMADREGYLAARERRFEAYRAPIPDQVWSGAFQRPAAGRVSSAYGVYRAYSTGDRSHHTAIDISNRPGTPIYAANDGVVTLSEFMHTFGNAVVLGHGQGLSTSYSHLSERLVEQGQRVTRGQLIGRMGSTGLSTGPHLHWGMIVHDVSVDPAQWETSAMEYSEALAFE